MSKTKENTHLSINLFRLLSVMGIGVIFYYLLAALTPDSPIKLELDRNIKLQLQPNNGIWTLAESYPSVYEGEPVNKTACNIKISVNKGIRKNKVTRGQS